jgi:hypothetical protein
MRVRDREDVYVCREKEREKEREREEQIGLLTEIVCKS